MNDYLDPKNWSVQQINARMSELAEEREWHEKRVKKSNRELNELGEILRTREQEA